jgi:hypothetical protein
MLVLVLTERPRAVARACTRAPVLASASAFVAREAGIRAGGRLREDP